MTDGGGFENLESGTLESVRRASSSLYAFRHIEKTEDEMRGTPPKPAHQRRNRNPLRGGDWVLLPEGRKGPAPSCAGYGLSRATQAWWRAIWRSPMATQWNESHVPALLELAILRDQLMAGETKVAAEVRIRSDGFGLTPAGLQQRRWMITEKDQERAGFKKPGASVIPLRAVDDD